MPCSIAQSTVRRNTSSSSSSMPKTKLPLIMMPRPMQPIGHRLVVAAQVLALVAADEIPRRQALEPDEEAAKPGLRGALDEIAAQDGVDGRRALKEPVHPAHAVEQRRGRSAGRRGDDRRGNRDGVPADARFRRARRPRAACRTIGRPRRRRPCSRSRSAPDSRASRRWSSAPGSGDARSDRGAPAAGGPASAPTATDRPRCGRPARKSARNCGNVCSAGPRNTASACAAASSGSDVTCSPPIATNAPSGPVVVGDAIGAIGVGDVDLDQDEIRAVVERRASARARRRAPPRRPARETPPAWRGRAAETAST